MRQSQGRTRFRTLLLACALIASAGGTALAQGGDGSWWESLPGFGRSYGSPRRTSEEEPRRRGEVVDDLRADATPLRSDLMVAALPDAIHRYQEIVARGGWPQLPGSRMIRPEDNDDRIPLLRRRLMIGGELSRRAADAYGGGYSYGADLEAAVRRFQINHGLRVSGRVDKPTLDALNVPAQARLSQLRLNLQRLRDLGTQRTEDRYILVNVPAFQLEAVEHYQVELRHRVIAGKAERQTPNVRATIKALNFFPYWRVPESVAALDLIPRLAKEPDYREKEQIRVLSGNYNGPEIDPTNIDWRHADASKIRFRQDPGPQNALGLVRLDMPNEHGVYMHDTPMKQLFSQRGRSFSAGCVRVQDVFSLAEWVARQEPGWEQPGRAHEILSAGSAFDLTLTRPVPVYFTYITAWAEPNGDIQFRPDIYGRDGMRDLIAAGHDPADGPPPAWRLAP